MNINLENIKKAYIAIDNCINDMKNEESQQRQLISELSANWKGKDSDEFINKWESSFNLGSIHSEFIYYLYNTSKYFKKIETMSLNMQEQCKMISRSFTNSL